MFRVSNASESGDRNLDRTRLGNQRIDAAAAREALCACYPERELEPVRLLGEGWDSVVYLARKTILRFPKNAKAADTLTVELRLLPYLRDRLPLAIPQPACAKPHPLNPAWSFMTYERIGGSELDVGLFSKLTPSTQRRVTNQLATFLKTLHAIEVSAARDCGVKDLNLRAAFQNVYAESETVVASLDESERDGFTSWFRAILEDDDLFLVRPCLIHGDLSPEHIFFDRATQRLCGIIDFGDAAIGDPDYDFMYLLTDYGEPFLTSLLRHYRHPDANGLLRKLDAFRLFDAARYVLDGHARLDAAMIRDGVADLATLLRKRAATLVGSSLGSDTSCPRATATGAGVSSRASCT